MREIQDMTLNMARGLERLDKRLSARRERFQEEFECLENPENALGLRFTAMPVGDEIRFDRVFRNGAIVEELDEPWHMISLQEGNKQPHILDDSQIFSSGLRCRPMLRAAREESYWGLGNMSRSYNSYRELHCDGLIEVGFVSSLSSPKSKHHLPPSFPIVIFANLAVWADRIRNQALLPAAEYVLEAEIRAIEAPVGIVVDDRYIDTPYTTILQPGLIEFPRYSLGGPDEISNLLTLFHRDFWNSLGKDVGDKEITFTIKD